MLRVLFVPKTSVHVNSLQNDNILDRSKMKAFADNNLYVVQIMIYVLDKFIGLKTVGKRENA